MTSLKETKKELQHLVKICVLLSRNLWCNKSWPESTLGSFLNPEVYSSWSIFENEWLPLAPVMYQFFETKPSKKDLTHLKLYQQLLMEDIPLLPQVLLISVSPWQSSILWECAGDALLGGLASYRNRLSDPQHSVFQRRLIGIIIYFVSLSPLRWGS